MRIRLLRRCLFVLLNLLSSAMVWANDSTTMSFAVNSPGTAPYLYYVAESDEYRGVVPDLFASLSASTSLHVEFIDSHRNRSESFVYRGDIDMFLSSIDWITDPSAVIATSPLLEHKSYLYSLNPLSEDFSLSTIQEWKVCTRRGFTYPSLEPLFEAGQLLRIDSRSHKTMLKMLVKGRCDLVEINEHNANALFRLDELRSLQFYRSPEPTSIVELSLLMHPSRSEQRDIIDEAIKRFKSSGEFETSLNSHSSQRAVNE